VVVDVGRYLNKVMFKITVINNIGMYKVEKSTQNRDGLNIIIIIIIIIIIMIVIIVTSVIVMSR
jgi:hypothetical protein